MSPTVAALPWYGHLLGELNYGSSPIASRLLSQTVLAALQALGVAGLAPTMVNAASVVLGAAASATAAWIAMRIAGRWATEESVPGAGAAMATAGSVTVALMLASPGLSRVATAAHPGTLTLFGALLGMAALVGTTGTWSTPAAVLAGAGVGLATANHPGFGLLIPVLVIAWALGASSSGRSGVAGVAGIALASLTTGLAPLWTAALSGDSLQAFLSHALLTPYPTPGDGSVDLEFGSRLSLAMPLGMLTFSPLAIPLLRSHSTRGTVLAGGALFLLFGPLFPALTNQYGASHALRDTEAPLLVPMAVGCIASGLGAGLCIAMISRSGLRQSTLVAAGLVVAGLAAAAVSPLTVNRRHYETQTIAQGILQACPPGSVLITTDDLLHSIAVGGRYVANAMGPATIVPFKLLSDESARSRAAAASPALPDLLGPVSLSASWDRWQREQPGLVADLVGRAHDVWERGSVIAMLAVWDYIRQTQGCAAVCVAGQAPVWLSARCGPAGLVLRHPAPDQPASTAIGAARAALDGIARASRDPGHRTAVQRLLTALAANARHRGDTDQARRFAADALRLRPESAAAATEAMLADARAGSADQAVAGAERVMRIHPRVSPDRLASQVKQALSAHTVVAEFRLLARTAPTGPDGIEQLHRAATALWYNEELSTLAQGYADWLARVPDEPTALYERAAALTQLGQLQAARESLIQVLKIAPMETAVRLRHDGRFYQYDEEAPEGE